VKTAVKIPHFWRTMAHIRIVGRFEYQRPTHTQPQFISPTKKGWPSQPLICKALSLNAASYSAASFTKC